MRSSRTERDHQTKPRRHRRSSPLRESFTLLPALGALALAAGCGAPAEDVEDVIGTRTADIIGGTTAIPGGHPWIARLYTYSQPPVPDQPGVHGSCGGTLIAPDWILTAAHCVDDVSPLSAYAVLGEHDTNTDDGFEQVALISEILIHPDYGPPPGGGHPHHDVALVRLPSPVTLNSRVATLPLASARVTGGTGIAAGWGPTDGFDPEQQESAVLRRVSLPIQSASTCNDSELHRDLQNDELCAGTATAGTCHGDSGGPLLRPRIWGGYELIGVTSWGSLYCTSPSVYSRVSSAYDWIRSYVP